MYVVVELSLLCRYANTSRLVLSEFVRRVEVRYRLAVSRTETHPVFDYEFSQPLV